MPRKSNVKRPGVAGAGDGPRPSPGDFGSAPGVTQAAPTAPPMRDAQGFEIDQWGVRTAGPARIAQLADMGMPDPQDDPEAWVSMTGGAQGGGDDDDGGSGDGGDAGVADDAGSAVRADGGGSGAGADGVGLVASEMNDG